MAKAKRGDKVQIHYTGKLDNGRIFDSSIGSGSVLYGPLEFILGQGDLPPKCQEAIVGLEPGQKLQVLVPCREAYGPRNETLIFVTPRAELSPVQEQADSWRYPKGKQLRFNPKKGDQLEVTLMDGNSIPVTVTQIDQANITLDANHPLAGKDLTFEIKLVNIL
jgi:peptidylprolyl isomerase